MFLSIKGSTFCHCCLEVRGGEHPDCKQCCLNEAEPNILNLDTQTGYNHGEDIMSRRAKLKENMQTSVKFHAGINFNNQTDCMVSYFVSVTMLHVVVTHTSLDRLILLSLNGEVLKTRSISSMV